MRRYHVNRRRQSERARASALVALVATLAFAVLLFARVVHADPPGAAQPHGGACGPSGNCVVKSLRTTNSGVDIALRNGNTITCTDATPPTLNNYWKAIGYQSSAAASASVFACDNVGARLSCGSTARYFYDDGGGFHFVNNTTSDGYFAGNSGTTAFYAATSGAFESNGTVTLKSESADGAGAIAAKSDTTTAWANAGAKLHSFRTNNVEKSYVDINGRLCSAAGACASLGVAQATGCAWHGSNATAVNAPFGAFVAQAASVGGGNFSISVTTAGAGAGNLTLQAFDVTAAASRCTCTIPCATTVNTSAQCTCDPGTSIVAGNRMEIRVSGDGCTATSQPIGNVCFTFKT